MSQRISKKRIEAAMEAANLCPNKGRRFRDMVERMGLKAAYEAAVREAFDYAPSRARINRFDKYDIGIPLENLWDKATDGCNYINVFDIDSSTWFLGEYPYEWLRNMILKLNARNERVRAAA